MTTARFWLAILVSCVVLFPAAPACAQGCGTKGDWRDIYILPPNGNADTNIRITLSVDKDRVEPGDELVITFQADRDCYLTLMDMGTSGRIIRLWPNEYSGNDSEALLSACLDDQVSHEDQTKQAGLFIHNIIKAIEEGANTLDLAFEKAKRVTEQHTQEIARRTGGTISIQILKLTDPHGFARLFKFAR